MANHHAPGSCESIVKIIHGNPPTAPSPAAAAIAYHAKKNMAPSPAAEVLTLIVPKAAHISSKPAPWAVKATIVLPVSSAPYNAMPMAKPSNRVNWTKTAMHHGNHRPVRALVSTTPAKAARPPARRNAITTNSKHATTITNMNRKPANSAARKKPAVIV